MAFPCSREPSASGWPGSPARPEVAFLCMVENAREQDGLMGRSVGEQSVGGIGMAMAMASKCDENRVPFRSAFHSFYVVKGVTTHCQGG
jgi:hypothetical protein